MASRSNCAPFVGAALVLTPRGLVGVLIEALRQDVMALAVHRPAEAIEIVLLANHMLRIVGALRAAGA